MQHKMADLNCVLCRSLCKCVNIKWLQFENRFNSLLLWGLWFSVAARNRTDAQALPHGGEHRLSKVYTVNC